jgi:hypothetical protein
MSVFLTRSLHALNRIRLWIARPLTLGVRLILVKDGSVVLVRHTYQDFWFLPGGGVEKARRLKPPPGAKRVRKPERSWARSRCRAFTLILQNSKTIMWRFFIAQTLQSPSAQTVKLPPASFSGWMRCPPISPPAICAG